MKENSAGELYSFFPLCGRFVELQRFTESCITSDYLRWLQDAEVLRFSNQRFRTHTRESCLKYLASFDRSANYFLAVYARETGRMVGTMTAYVNEHHGTADIGILIGNRAVWGRGMGYDAWAVLMVFLLDQRGLRKVTGGAVRCNVGMVRIMERSGMHLEAVKKKQELIDGKPEDVLLYAKFRDGWPNPAGVPPCKGGGESQEPRSGSCEA